MNRNKLLARLSLLGLIAYALLPMAAQATGQLTARSATVTDSTGAATGVTYTVKFKAGTAGNVGSIKFEICDSPVESTACAGTTTSSGASLAAAGLTGAFAGTNWSTPTWTKGSGADAPTGPGAGGTSVKFAASAQTSVATTDQATVTLTNVVNPTANNKEYYLRITTYQTTAYGTEVDYGATALSTTQAIQVSGYMPESLVFCVGATVTADCTTIGGAAVDLGTFSPVAASTGTSQMAASTNAGSGYAITINGSTMASGGNQITACAAGCASTTGTSQFGTNTVANTTPTVGANVTPTGAGYNGAAANNYNTANTFRFATGETVASSATISNAQAFTNSYLVNVPGSQAAGLYTSTLTYICTATF